MTITEVKFGMHLNHFSLLLFHNSWAYLFIQGGSTIGMTCTGMLLNVADRQTQLPVVSFFVYKFQAHVKYSESNAAHF